AGQPLDVVRGRAVVPDDAAGAGTRNRAHAVAPVGPEHEPAAALDELGVEPRRALRLAAVVEQHELAARVARPRLEAGPDLSALDGVAAGQRDRRAEGVSPDGGRAWARPRTRSASPPAAARDRRPRRRT